jgi:hypothetical protein
VMAAALGDCASLQRCSPAIFLITLALVQLRAGALIFPCPPTRGEAFSVLLRSYAKRTRKADRPAAGVIGGTIPRGAR